MISLVMGRGSSHDFNVCHYSFLAILKRESVCTFSSWRIIIYGLY